jgi:hypothetical protein
VFPFAELSNSRNGGRCPDCKQRCPNFALREAAC